jgi:catechol 2,3-dioxygenase-like lactoylglutathione lyase family enzyme
MLSTPRFHHLHLHSTDPDAAIAFYVRQFPTSHSGTWGGSPALFAPDDVMILFDQVDSLPADDAQSAIWHFGWHVIDSHRSVERFEHSGEVALRPLFTGIEEDSVWLSSDTWYRSGDRLGVTLEQIERMRSEDEPPPGGPGFAYFDGPDGALVEIAGDYPAERFNHVHMWQENALCAQLWYQRHLNAAPRASYGELTVTEDDCKVARTADRTFPALTPGGMYRAPRGGVTFGNVDMMWYPNQSEGPLVPSRGQLQDHIALAVDALGPWLDKLRKEDVAEVTMCHGGSMARDRPRDEFPM